LDEALAAAWRAFDFAPADLDVKRLLSRLLRNHPELARTERREDLIRLLIDPQIDPILAASAGWHAFLADEKVPTAAEAPEALAAWADADPLAHHLLEQSPVAWPAAETTLTRLRRWLLLTGRWSDFPRLVETLRVQAMLNGGAWPRDESEQAELDAAPDTPIAAAYSPPPLSATDGISFADPVTRAVADQYRNWPYPPWSRITPPRPTTLPDRVAAFDGGRPSGLPVDADILIAGCGTGREAALTALTYPDAKIVAVDFSETSLAYARERCAAAGIGNLDFRLLDIHRVADLGMSFDLVACCGVLHHLPDPEAGWAALTAVLRPGGVMRIMVYSIVARLQIRAARSLVADLLDRPVDDDLLRAVRHRLIEKAPDLLSDSYDFYTLAGLHDLLLHSHEDPFDVSRIKRAIDSLGLELITFALPTPYHRARYRREHPGDPCLRDVAAWASLEKTEPSLFAGMHKFWCRKPAG
jgi:SAM-dependent methyltransferase